MNNWKKEEDYLLLSGIQHYAFCPRQWALIHIEQLWEDNILTFRGQELHQKTNDPFIMEKRNDKVTARAVPIISHRLRLQGVADVIEFERSEEGVKLKGRSGMWWPLPVEYKVGKPKVSHCDILQLCAQAMCLEEMFDVTLDKGHIFYGKTRRRQEILLTQEIREETQQTAEQMHDNFRLETTPKAEYSSICESCSLIKFCIPTLSKKRSLKDYLHQTIGDSIG